MSGTATIPNPSRSIALLSATNPPNVTLRWPAKTPGSTLDYWVDATGALAEQSATSITSATATVRALASGALPDLAVTSPGNIVGNSIGFILSDGSSPRDYGIDLSITLNTGTVIAVTVWILVVNASPSDSRTPPVIVGATGDPGPPGPMGTRGPWVSIADYIPTTASHDLALAAAWAALPAAGGIIMMPAASGPFVLEAPVVLGAKPVRFLGDGLGLTIVEVAHAGIGVAINQGANYTYPVEIEGMTVRGADPAAVSAAAFSITYAQAPSIPFPGVRATDVRIECATGAGTANGFAIGFKLNGAWNARFTRCEMEGFGLAADGMQADGVTANFKAVAGACMFDLANCVDIIMDQLQVYYVDSVVVQTGYCEGIYFIAPAVIGSNWLVTQSDVGQPFGQSFTGDVNDYNGDGLWIIGGEVNTVSGVCQMARFVEGAPIGCQITRYMQSPEGFVAFDLTDCLAWTGSGIKAESGVEAGAIFLRLTGTGASNTTPLNCVFTGLSLNNFGTDLAMAGPVQNTTFDVALCVKNSVRSSPTVTDTTGMTDNVVISRPQPGMIGGNGSFHGFAGPAGEALFVVEALPDVVNQVRAIPAAQGLAPAVRFDGLDGTPVNGVPQSVSGQIIASGSGVIVVGNDAGLSMEFLSGRALVKGSLAVDDSREFAPAPTAGPIAGRWRWGVNGGQFIDSAIGNAADIVWWMPVHVPAAMTALHVGIHVIGEVAGATCEVAVYAAQGGGPSGAPLFIATGISCATLGDVMTAVDWPLASGLYLIGLRCSVDQVVFRGYEELAAAQVYGASGLVDPVSSPPANASMIGSWAAMGNTFGATPPVAFSTAAAGHSTAPLIALGT
jgi:hypothetical protein